MHCNSRQTAWWPWKSQSTSRIKLVREQKERDEESGTRRYYSKHHYVNKQLSRDQIDGSDLTIKGTKLLVLK